MDIAFGNYFAFFYLYTFLPDLFFSCSAGLVRFMGCHSVCLLLSWAR